MKKLLMMVLVCLCCILTGCGEDAEARLYPDKSDVYAEESDCISITIYTATGEVMKQFSIKSWYDFSYSDGYVCFDLGGKTYKYINCFIEIIE